MKNHWHIIGLMSGTSLDGVDIVFVHFQKEISYSYNILAAETIPYSPEWKNKLQQAFFSTGQELIQLHTDYGKYLGELVNDFILKNKLAYPDFIASHGHTIFHNPSAGYTFQLGDGASLAQTCQRTVVCDFRSQDVARGGQGAPLVPMGDLLLFPEYDYCLNIGGFANISYNHNGVRKAQDICPANILLNHYTRKINLEYDDGGEMARKGKINTALLQALNTHPIYSKKDSLAFEIIVSDFIPLIDSFQMSIPDILRTLIEHISLKIKELVYPNTQVLVTGGGALNHFLMERIQHGISAKITTPTSDLIHFKEALIFALLGLLKMENKINILASVTGANRDHSGGIVYDY